MDGVFRWSGCWMDCGVRSLRCCPLQTETGNTMTLIQAFVIFTFFISFCVGLSQGMRGA
jgi:hypothetical protein